MKIVKHLLFLECIHARKEPVMVHAKQLVLGNKTIEWFWNYLFAWLYFIKNRLFKNKEPRIHPQLGFGDGGDIFDRAIFVRTYTMKGLSGTYGHKGSDRIVLPMAIDQIG